MWLSLGAMDFIEARCSEVRAGTFGDDGETRGGEIKLSVRRVPFHQAEETSGAHIKP